MALTKSENNTAMLVADQAYYLNADKSKVVPGDSPEAAFLLVAEGGEIAPNEAAKYGLKAGAEPKTEDEPKRAAKRSAGPSEDK